MSEMKNARLAKDTAHLSTILDEGIEENALALVFEGNRTFKMDRSATVSTPGAVPTMSGKGMWVDVTQPPPAVEVAAMGPASGAAHSAAIQPPQGGNGVSYAQQSVLPIQPPQTAQAPYAPYPPHVQYQQAQPQYQQPQYQPPQPPYQSPVPSQPHYQMQPHAPHVPPQYTQQAAPYGQPQHGALYGQQHPQNGYHDPNQPYGPPPGYAQMQTTAHPHPGMAVPVPLTPMQKAPPPAVVIDDFKLETSPTESFTQPNDVWLALDTEGKTLVSMAMGLAVVLKSGDILKQHAIASLGALIRAQMEPAFRAMLVEQITQAHANMQNYQQPQGQ